MPRIDRMVANIRKFGIFTPNKYLIEFSGLIGAFDIFQNNRLSLMCNRVSVPARSIASLPDNNGLGPSREVPYAPLYENELQFEFYLAKDVWERRVFEAWMDATIDPVSGRMAYFKDIACDAYIYILNEFDFPIYRIRLENVWPKQVDAVELSNENGGEIARQGIILSFQRYVPTIVTLGGAVGQEFLYDVPSVRQLDNNVGGLMNDAGIFGGKFGNPLNFSQVFTSWADAGAVVEKPFTNFNLGGLGTII